MSHIKELSHDFTRGIIFGAGLSIGIGAIVLSSIAFASSTGGKFGEAIDAILAPGYTWQSPGDGTVKNALNIMSGSDAIGADKLVKFQSTTGCPTGFAIRSIETNGNINCTPIPTAP